MFKKAGERIKPNVMAIAIAIGMMAFCYSIFVNVNTGFKILSFLYFLIFNVFSGRDTQLSDSKKEELRRKGLTEEDVDNISFVKQWEEIREAGRNKYLIIDGGVFCAFGLGFLLFLTAAIFFRESVFSDGPGKVFSIIGYSLLSGFIAGILINRSQWGKSERRFKQLTQFSEKDLITF
jgi:Na+/melibiose symporter-like transporter